MKIAVIADDLTGANDTGVKFAQLGLRTWVSLASLAALPPVRPERGDVFVWDTDSRSMEPDEAYHCVRRLAETVRDGGFELIYKKLDSTMRGNIGAELDALYDVLTPDFAVVAPSYPAIGRKVVDGCLYVHDVLLHETAAAADPKTPVKESFVPRLLATQTSREIVQLPLRELEQQSDDALHAQLAAWKGRSVSYVVADAVSDEHLARLVKLFQSGGYRVLWAGSAGLAAHLSAAADTGGSGASLLDPPSKGDAPVLTVVGSVHEQTRRQLQTLLRMTQVKSVPLAPELIVGGAVARGEEMERAFRQAVAQLARGRHVVLHSAADEQAVVRAVEAGRTFGRSAPEVSEHIAVALGEVAAQLVQRCALDKLVLTGGDTARKVCTQLSVAECLLLNEMESGVPYGYIEDVGLHLITKAGGFGSEHVLVNALYALEGRDRE